MRPDRLTEQPPHRCCPPHPCSVMTPRQASPQRFPKMELSRFPLWLFRVLASCHHNSSLARWQSARRRPGCCQIHPASERPAARHKELLSRPEPSGEHPPSEGLCAWPLSQACSCDPCATSLAGLPPSGRGHQSTVKTLCDRRSPNSLFCSRERR